MVSIQVFEFGWVKYVAPMGKITKLELIILVISGILGYEGNAHMLFQLFESKNVIFAGFG